MYVLYAVIFIVLFHITVEGNTYCTFGDIVRQQIVHVHCVDCVQILRILSMLVEYVQPPL